MECPMTDLFPSDRPAFAARLANQRQRSENFRRVRAVRKERGF
jgi:hypothetical protein